ncbi:DEAD/DEAH box helicase [Desulforhopalus vacuolatus]|uniref:DEAD/DEAH box helicase n=1 Tax=Desulforhopalus vacuolatus TaxID=40414 RepID=UPI001964DC57|nr:DEAD/DEAH box helicase [Desulforhopalus vacuolatus]MBM9519697.1 DEAD/DEAH box helicase [Desulforhopalus vacuolatus]
MKKTLFANGQRLQHPADFQEKASRKAEAQAPAAEQGSREAIQSVSAEKPVKRQRVKKAHPAKEAKPVWTRESFVVPPEKGRCRFHDFDIPDEVMHAVADLGFQHCTPVQEQSLSNCLGGKDFVGKANTGTGKTAVFLITTFTRLLTEKLSEKGRNGAPRALVIVPTRELVIQIGKDAGELGKYCNINVRTVFGGVDYQKQMSLLRESPCDLLVATPGRLLDFIGKGVVNLSTCEILILDEADRMLDMGFIPDVRRIVGRLPQKEKRQTLLFSATITEAVRRLAYQWCVDPVMVDAEPEHATSNTVEEVVYLASKEEKYTIIYNVLKAHPEDRTIIFANMRGEARRVADRLKRNAIDCVLLSGEVPQNKRTSRLERFREGKVKVLVATDVAGRGIHINDIRLVINHSVPFEPEDYIHRIGRTGRAGATGRAISFACEEGSFYLPAIEDLIGEKFNFVVPEEELLEIPPPLAKAPARKEGGRPGAGTLSNKRRRSRQSRDGGGRSSGSLSNKKRGGKA